MKSRFCQMILLFFAIFLSASLPLLAGEPYCDIRTYDERDGLSQRLVKQVVQDDNGVLWVATWNGLNRFDGYEFRCIRPGINDAVRRHSSRFSDIRLGKNGQLWCRIDHAVVRFDVDTYRFYDSQAMLEQKFGRSFRVSKIMVTTDDEVIAQLEDNTYIIMGDGQEPENGAIMTGDIGNRRHKSTGNRKIGDIKGYDRNNLIVARSDEAGTVWLVTRDGDVLCSSGDDGRFVQKGHIDNDGLRYGLTDTQGNIWFNGKTGLHKLSFGTAPYSFLEEGRGSMLRTSYRDSDGNIWMAWSNPGYVSVYESKSGRWLYLCDDGVLSESRKSPSGWSVYSIFESSPGVIWLGTKPDGLFRLTKNADGKGYVVNHFKHDDTSTDTPSGKSYYDGVADRYGRLWLASMDKGIDLVENPSAEAPRFINISTLGDFPTGATSVRRIRIVNDTLAVAATTGGLLFFPIRDNLYDSKIPFKLHTSEPGRGLSLGNVATMDVALGCDGSLFIATESDGVSRMLTPLSDDVLGDCDFKSYRTVAGINHDVALSVVPLSEDSLMLVTGNNDIYLLNPATDDTRIFGYSFWHNHLRFSDARPLHLGDKGWLIGLTDGAVMVNPSKNILPTDTLDIVFNTISTINHVDSLLTPLTERIVLGSDERDFTLKFSALCYGDPSAICYAFKVDDDEWTNLGTSRVLSFANVKPGTYTVTIRSTDTYGQWLDNERSVVIEVKPEFWETGWAKALYIILLLAIVGTIIWVIVYIRRIKRKQRELLELQLQRIDARVNSVDDLSLQQTPGQDDGSDNLSDENRQLIDAVMKFIEENLSDPTVTVDDMALAAAVSRSGLTRKMKSLMGVTPADFLKETRLTRAATLLTTTDKPIKEIAALCGFADMNYFGKCFKSSRSMTPGAYRKQVIKTY